MMGLHRGPNIRDPPFVFAAYFIRAYLRGASFGARLNDKHKPVIVLIMAWVR
jgi:hypothetical protein